MASLSLILEKLAANLPILDYCYILTGRINKAFPVVAYMSKKKKLLAQTEHLSYMFLGILAQMLLQTYLALLIFAGCFVVAFPLELYLIKKYPNFVTWEWAKNKSYKFILSVFGWVSINIILYYLTGIIIGKILF
ncbi:hypothetical protein CW703_00185 [Candidatus Bathyarchaeota archaeon]|nr:MAG: hypothetical protein CW703_00185 [Candidatus Bathyarchaeota archaeon]